MIWGERQELGHYTIAAMTCLLDQMVGVKLQAAAG